MELSKWRKAGTRLVRGRPHGVRGGACSDTPKPESELGQGGRHSPATPGSARDFAVNVGDIVYFTTDSVDLSPEAQQTLTNQARWLQQYSQYTITIEGHADERGTREYNIALGAQARPGRAQLPGPARHQRPAHPHDLLRQGAARGGVQRHLLLVAEPPRPDRAQQPPRSSVLGRHSANQSLAPMPAQSCRRRGKWRAGERALMVVPESMLGGFGRGAAVALCASDARGVRREERMQLGVPARGRRRISNPGRRSRVLQRGQRRARHPRPRGARGAGGLAQATIRLSR